MTPESATVAMSHLLKPQTERSYVVWTDGKPTTVLHNEKPQGAPLMCPAPHPFQYTVPISKYHTLAHVAVKKSQRRPSGEGNDDSGVKPTSPGRCVPLWSSVFNIIIDGRYNKVCCCKVKHAWYSYVFLELITRGRCVKSVRLRLCV